MKNRFLDFNVKIQNQIVLRVSTATGKPINIIGQAFENVNPQFSMVMSMPIAIEKQFVPLLYVEVEKLEGKETPIQQLN
jgi:hypothetical protein